MDRAFSPQTVSMSEFLGLYPRLEWGRADGPRTNSSHSSSVEPFKAWGVGPQTNRGCGTWTNGAVDQRWTEHQRCGLIPAQANGLGMATKMK